MGASGYGEWGDRGGRVHGALMHVKDDWNERRMVWMDGEDEWHRIPCIMRVSGKWVRW